MVGIFPQPGMGLTTATYLSQFSYLGDRLDRQDMHSGQHGTRYTWMEGKIRKQEEHKMGRQTETQTLPTCSKAHEQTSQGC